MGIQQLQRFIEAHVPGACVPVDLLEIARGVTLSGPRTPSSRHRPPPSVELCLVLDAEGCLDRLYGGYFSDWVCGGQWNRMVQFLAVLIQTVQANNMELAVFFSGALELPRMRQWVTQQYGQRRDINQALKHAALKATPPPKVWWTPPGCLRTALRMALRHLEVQVLCSTDDHRQEVMAFCREHNYHGVMAEDAEYIVLNPPRYFSAKQMKLTYKGSLETKEYILSEVARGLDLQPSRFSLLAALLGGYLLTDDDLAEFHGRLTSQAGAKPGGEELPALLVEFVRALPAADDLQAVGVAVFGSASDSRTSRLQHSVSYLQTTVRDTVPLAKASPSAGETASNGGGLPADAGLGEVIQQMDNLTTEDDSAPGSFNGRVSPANELADVGPEGPHVSLTPPLLPAVSAEVLRTAAERHQKGLMSPWVYQVLSQGEVKLPVSLEDELNREVPNAAIFYRPAREHVYAVLFNLYHHSFLNNRDKELPAEEQHQVPVVQVREWAYTRSNPYTRPDLVTARPLGWGVPTVQRLWFGTTDDDKKRRLRALLSCVSADSPYIRNPAYVPQQLLVLACVLRYMMCQSSITGQPFLCKPELDAFIAQALSPKLTDSQYLQDLQLQSVSARGVQLASLFMQGVETVLFANDACGAPIPWLMCCPWLFFDGKLFHSYLLKATQCRNVLELCDGRPELANQLELLRRAVLDGLSVQFGRPAPPQQLHQQQQLERRLGRGGRLQIGGVVVGSWAGNAAAAAAGAPLLRAAAAAAGRAVWPPQPAAGRPAKPQNKKKSITKKGDDATSADHVLAAADTAAGRGGAGEPGHFESGGGGGGALRVAQAAQ